MTKDTKKNLRKEMKRLRKLNQDYRHLATCPESYALYKHILYS